MEGALGEVKEEVGLDFEPNDNDIIKTTGKGTVDRPMGTTHPRNPDKSKTWRRRRS